MVDKRYNIREAAQMLGIKTRTAREWIRQGKLPAQKYDVSNRWYIRESDIARIIRGSSDADTGR